MKGRKRPAWPVMTAILLGLIVLYVASFGPTCWITSRLDGPQRPLKLMYRPLGRAAWLMPGGGFFPILLVQFGASFEEESRPVARSVIWEAAP